MMKAGTLFYSALLLQGFLPFPAPHEEDLYSQFNTSEAVYRNNVKFYSTNEPAIDLAVGRS
jgi:hypothetical protein